MAPEARPATQFLKVITKAKEAETDVHNDWCPGCGDFGILKSVQSTMAALNMRPDRTVVFSGIGCSGKTSHYINAYGVHTLHGRVLAFATGGKIANPELHVIVVGGDGDGMGIGACHFVNAGRRNTKMTYILHDNGVYGLTKGQASPTLDLGVKTKSLAAPNINDAINPLWLALASGYTFVARTYAFDIPHQAEIFKRAFLHKGTAFVDVLQPCPTYNDINTRDFYGGADRKDEKGRPMPRVHDMHKDPKWDPVVKTPDESLAKMQQAFARATEGGDSIPLGVFYQNEHVPTYEERIGERMPLYKKAPPSTQDICDEKGNPNTDLRPLYDHLSIYKPR